MAKLNPIIDDLDGPPEPPEGGCKGLVYMCHETAYEGSRGEIVMKTEMRPLKRRSCPGCTSCYSDLEFLRECDYHTIWDNLQPGRAYRLSVHSWQDYAGEWDSEILWEPWKPPKSDLARDLPGID